MDFRTAAVEELRGWIIKDIEIFKAGTYRDIPYTEDHLDEMVKNFLILKSAGTFEPVFKKDHSESVEDQIGWIANVYREGDLLKADLHVTEWMAMDKIESKTWKYVSSEIYPPELAAGEFGDSIQGHVLRGVAIVSVPKVKGLKGIVLNSEILEKGVNIVDRKKVEALMKKHGIYTDTEIAAFSDDEIFAKFEEGIAAKFAEEPEETVVTSGAGAAGAAGVAQFGEGGFVVVGKDDFAAMVKSAAGSEKQTVDLFAEVAALKNESKGQKIERRLSILMKSGKVTPAEKEGILAFSEKLDGENLEMYFGTFEKRTAVVNFEELPGGQQGSDDEAEGWASYKELRTKKTYE
jgi:hypothetical protein